MRIIAGKYKRRKLNYPKDDKNLRPTRDMVKEALFSVLQTKVPGSHFLDLFAGVGSIGLEALSRGAAEVVLIDENPKYIFENARLLSCERYVQIFKNDVETAVKILGKKGKKFDIIYLDPPYDSNLAEDSLNKIRHFDILEPDGLIIIETSRTKDIQTDFPVKLERVYGQTKLIILENDNLEK